MNSDIVFWYTGLAIWGIIAFCVAVTVLIAFLVGAAQAYHRSKQWSLIWRMAYMTHEERSIFFDWARDSGLTDAEWKKFLLMISKHRKALSKMSKGPIMDIECSEWYELTDGTKGQIVRTSPGPWQRTQGECEMRTDKNETFIIRADGVLLHNPAIRILRKTEAGQFPDLPKKKVELLSPSSDDAEVVDKFLGKQ